MRVAHTCVDQPNLPCPACTKADIEGNLQVSVVKESHSRSMVELVNDFKERNLELLRGEICSDLKHEVIRMHSDLAEFMDMVITWMHVRETRQVR